MPYLYINHFPILKIGLFKVYIINKFLTYPKIELSIFAF